MNVSHRYAAAVVASLLAALTLAAPAEKRPPGIPWLTDYAEAAGAAKRSGRPLLVFFCAEWCGGCRLMEQTTFRDPAVTAVLRQMTCVRADVDRDRGTARQFQVSAIPRVIVRGRQQTTVLDAAGYVDAEALLAMLKSSASQLGGLKLPTNTSAEAVTASGSRAALIEALGNPQRARREEAAAALRQLGNKAIPPLLDALTHKHLAVRLGAWATLSEMLRPPARLRYDPWAASSVRQARAEALRGWVRTRGRQQ